MKFNLWSPEEEKLLSDLIKANTPVSLIFNCFKQAYEEGWDNFDTLRTVKAIQRKILRGPTALAADLDSKDSDREPLPIKVSTDTETVAKAWKAIQDLQSAYVEKQITKHVGVMDPIESSTKILCLSDIHFPLARVDLLQSIVEEHLDADIVVVNGDLMEGYAFSTFEKDKRIAALHEYNAAFEFVEMLSKTFPKVILVAGNHDVRTSRSLKSASYDTEATSILRPNLIARMANGERLDNHGRLVEKLDFKNVYFDPHESWYVLVGKTIFCHPHGKGGSQPGWTVQRANDGVFSKRYSRQEYDSIVCGHTHKIYKGVIDGVLLMEQGCLAGLLAYSHSPTMHYTTNGMNGYAVIYQDSEGNTDFNKSNVIYLGQSFPPKKSMVK